MTPILTLLAMMLMPVSSAAAQDRDGRSTPIADTTDVAAIIRDLGDAFDSGRDSLWLARWRPAAHAQPTLQALVDGTHARLLYRPSDAERAYVTALTDTTHPAAAHALIGLAALRVSAGDPQEAERLYGRAFHLATLTHDSVVLVESLLGRAALVLRSAGADSARRLLAMAEPVFPANARLRMRATCFALTVSLQARARIDDSTWQRVRREAALQSNRLGADCAFVHAQYTESVGRQATALQMLDTLAITLERLRNWQTLAAVRQWQGTMLIAGRNLSRARARLLEARDHARRSGGVATQGWVENNLASVHMLWGLHDDAVDYLDRAMERFRRSRDGVGELYARQVMAEAAMLRGDFDRADAMLAEVSVRARGLVLSMEVQTLVARADIRRQRGEWAAAQTLLDSAERVSQRRNQPGWMGEVTYQRAVLDMHTGAHARALSRLDSVQARRVRGPALFEVLVRKAETFARAGQPDSAVHHFRSARITLDRWRSGFTERERVLSVLQDRALDWDRDLGLATIVAHLVQRGAIDEALAIAEWRRVRAQEQQALQRGLLRVEADGVTSVPTVPIDTTGADAPRLRILARGRIEPGHAVVSYVVGRGGEPGTAFVLTRDTLAAVPITPIDSLVAPIQVLLGFLESGQLPQPLVARLSTALVAPVMRILPPSVHTLTLVPDGPLHRVPFAVLLSADDTAPRTHPVLTIAPSVEDALGTVPRIARRSDARTPLLIGAPARMPIPVNAADSSRPWNALPGARRELQAIDRRVGGARLHLGNDATAQTFLREVTRGGSVLHVATHVVATTGSLERSAIVLQPSAGHDGLLRLGQLAAQPMPFDLVVYSACSSADGVAMVGQGLHGLVSTALDAGARGVIATRWDVSDTAMARFMTIFYDTLRVQPHVPRALLAAHRAAAAEDISPAVWAAVEYHGDPHLRVELPPPPSWPRRVMQTLRRWLG